MVQRNITVAVTGALPVDGFKAVIKRISEYEKQIANGVTITPISSVAVDPPLRIVATSLSMYQVYVLDIDDLDPAAGDYKLTLVSVGPNA